MLVGTRLGLLLRSGNALPRDLLGDSVAEREGRACASEIAVTPSISATKRQPVSSSCKTGTSRRVAMLILLLVLVVLALAFSNRVHPYRLVVNTFSLMSFCKPRFASHTVPNHSRHDSPLQTGTPFLAVVLALPSLAWPSQSKPTHHLTGPKCSPLHPVPTSAYHSRRRLSSVSGTRTVAHASTTGPTDPDLRAHLAVTTAAALPNRDTQTNRAEPKSRHSSPDGAHQPLRAMPKCLPNPDPPYATDTPRVCQSRVIPCLTPLVAHLDSPECPPGRA